MIPTTGGQNGTGFVLQTNDMFMPHKLSYRCAPPTATACLMRRSAYLASVAIQIALLAGCHELSDRWIDNIATLPGMRDPATPGVALAAGNVPNPLTVPVSDHNFVWNQIVDAVDDYFDIRSERRVQVLGNVLMEGRIETHPLPGATLLEPWRWDSVPGFQRDHASLQSVRRTATVRVLPSGSSYSIEVIVEKELEDVERPVHSTPGSATPRHDSSIVRAENVDPNGPRTLGWIPQGRDAELEAEIVQDIYARLTNAPAE